ncbi:MAG: hypothetical protein Q9198_008006 [Flavoplaca austrocitrina]
MSSIALRLRILGIALLLLIAAFYLSSRNIKTLRPNGIDRLTEKSAEDHSGDVTGFAHERASVDDDSHDIYNGSDLMNRYDGSGDRGLVKRILGEEFNCLLDRWWHSLVAGVFEAFHGRNDHPQHPSPKWGKNTFPTPDYGKVEDWLLKQHGWTRRQEDNAQLPAVWKGAFQMMPQGFAGHKKITRLTWTHDQRYSYVLEQREPTLAQYSNLFIPGAKAILTTKAASPKYMNSIRPAHVKEKKIPLLHQLSDIMWLDWGQVMLEPPALRYIARQQIAGTQIESLLDAIFKERRGTTDVPWEKRLTFALDTREAMAILGTATGNALVWLLIHNAKPLDKRNMEVTIFNPGGNNRCMIWDLMPGFSAPGAYAKGTFGIVESQDYCDIGSPTKYCPCVRCWLSSLPEYPSEP